MLGPYVDGLSQLAVTSYEVSVLNCFCSLFLINSLVELEFESVR